MVFDDEAAQCDVVGADETGGRAAVAVFYGPGGAGETPVGAGFAGVEEAVLVAVEFGYLFLEESGPYLDRLVSMTKEEDSVRVR